MAQRRLSTYFPLVFILTDLVFLNLSFSFANIMRFGTFLYTKQDYNILLIALNLLWIPVFFSSKLNEALREERLLDNLNKVLVALVINLAIVFAFWFIIQPATYSRYHLFNTYLFFSIGIIFWRIGWDYLIRYSRTKGYNIRNAIFLGYGDMMVEMMSFLKNNPELGYIIKGYFDDLHRGRDSLGKIDGVQAYSKKNDIDVMFCLLNQVGEERVKEIIDFAESNLIKVKILSQFSRLSNQNLTIQNYGVIPVLNVNEIPLDNKLNQSIKRGFDLIFSSLVIILLLSWLIPIIAIAIRLESKGPIFF